MRGDNLKIFIYGRGRVGGTLFSSLCKYSIVYYLNRSNRSKKGNSYSFDDFIKRVDEFDLIILSVPDDQIENVVDKIYLSSKRVKGVIICHTSGTISYKVLKPLRKKGFIIGSLHPYFSFYKIREDVPIENIRFTLSCDRDKKDYVLRVLKRAKIEALFIEDYKKVPYHISAVFVSNFSAALLKIAYELLKRAGFNSVISERFIFSLLDSTIFNLRNYGIERTITGPAIRRDKRVLDIHKIYLKRENTLLFRIYSDISDAIHKLY